MTFPKPCGRLDWHQAHEWTRPRDQWTAARGFHCAGRILVEGGYWLDWDAADDAAEDRADREKRDTP